MPRASWKSIGNGRGGDCRLTQNPRPAKSSLKRSVTKESGHLQKRTKYVSFAEQTKQKIVYPALETVLRKCSMCSQARCRRRRSDVELGRHGSSTTRTGTGLPRDRAVLSG